MKFKTPQPGNVGETFRDLGTGFNKGLSIADQFNSFTATVTINAGSTVTIANQLTDGQGNRIIPREWQVIDAAGASGGSIGRATTAWTTTHLYLKNQGNINGQFKIRFMERPKDHEDDLPLVAPATTGASEVWVGTPNGHGSSSTKIRIYTVEIVNTGSDITYATSATLGDSFTINNGGLFAITTGDKNSAGTATVGLSVNTSAPTTNIDSLSYANGWRGHTVSVSTKAGHYSTTLRLATNDIVRHHSNGTCDSTGARSAFHILRTGD